MNLPILDSLLSLPGYVLVLFRMSGLMMTAPLFSSAVIPLRIRAAFVMVAGAMMLPAVSPQIPSGLSLTGAFAGGLSELMVGATIGLSLAALLTLAQVAGTLIGQQGGFALSEVINPFQEDETAIIDQIYMVVVMLVFLCSGGHREAFAGLLDTYRAVPILSYQPGESMLVLLVEMLSAAFVVGIRMAGPVVIALFVTEAGMGLVSRTIPQFNILTVGFAIRTFMVLFAAAFSLPACQGMVLDAIWDGLDVIRFSFA